MSASLAELREKAVELRAAAAESLALADELDTRLAAAGHPTSATLAEVIAFPAGRRSRPDGSLRPADGTGAEIIDLAERRRA